MRRRAAVVCWRREDHAMLEKLVTPPEVSELLEKLLADTDPFPDEVAATELRLNLSYYRGGSYCWQNGRHSEAEILFVGTGDEASAWFEALPIEDIRELELNYIPTWGRLMELFSRRDLLADHEPRTELRFGFAFRDAVTE